MGAPVCDIGRSGNTITQVEEAVHRGVEYSSLYVNQSRRCTYAAGLVVFKPTVSKSDIDDKTTGVHRNRPTITAQMRHLDIRRQFLAARGKILKIFRKRRSSDFNRVLFSGHFLYRPWTKQK